MTQKWNLNLLYSTDQDWESDFRDFSSEKEELKKRFTELDFEKELGKILTSYFELERKAVKIYTYAHLKYDENLSNNVYKEMYGKAVFLNQDLNKDFCWIEPRILEIENSVFQKILEKPELSEFHFFLKKVYHLKPHTLDREKEEILSLSSSALSGPSKAFSAFNNADLSFEKILDEAGQLQPLTQALYINYLRKTDRILRKNAYEGIHQGYKNNENFLCELLLSEMNKHNFFAKARKYSSCLNAALFHNNIDTKVYHNLINATKSNISTLHDYISIRKNVLGFDKLYLYDLYVPLIEKCDITMTYEEARELVIKSVHSLGEEYQKTLSIGMKEKGWVDPFEQKGKRSGAYSSGCYDSEPYILMNYHNNLNDVFTLAHEAGHSMHTYFSNHCQNYQNSHYSIFLAEIASTFNELLLLKTLREKYKDNKEILIYLLLHQIDSFRATFFRQVQFAEFEELIHNKVESSEPLTPHFLSDSYKKLCQEYYGNDLELDPLAEIEWARIPHFYYNFYVYQYATGISIAYYFLEEIEKDPSKVDDYLRFIRSGGSEFPLDILEKSGVDLLNGNVIESALNRFSILVADLKIKFAESLECL